MPNRRSYFACSLALIQILLLGGRSEAATMSAEDLELYRQATFDDKQAAIDRRELVTPRQKGFKPALGQKIQLRLTVENRKLHRDEKIKYRLELINLGSTGYVVYEEPSFFKKGRLPGDRITLTLREPSGNTVNMNSPVQTAPDFGGDEIAFPPGLTDAQKDEHAAVLKHQAAASGKLKIELGPGEILHTRGDGASQFRPLIVMYSFKTPGVYELRAELDALLKKKITRSNTVRFEVAP